MEATATENVIAEGKFLTFALDEEIYGVEILRVREIICLITVPQTPDYMKGVINLRGKVIPVIDLRLKFSMPESEYTEETRIIVVEVGANGRLPVQWAYGHTSQKIGIIVDSVSEVLYIKGGEIEPAPGFGQAIDTKFILGLGKTKGKIIILLDIEKVLSSEELEMVEQLSK